MSSAPPQESPPPVHIQLLQPSSGFVTGTYAATIVVLTAFMAVAVLLTRRYLRSHDFSLDSFLTARGSSPWLRVGWSFYAGAMGAWAIATPAQFAATTGYISLIAYAISSGIPILLVAFFGERIQALLPRPLSLSDFVLWRFGRVAQIFVAFVCLFNMAIAIIAEYSVMGAIFQQFLNSSQYAIIVLVALLTMAYTAYGGLLISIITDQFQGITSVVLTLVLTLYLAISFRPSLSDFPTDTLGPTQAGWYNCFSLPISLIAATIFSEANWQRVWAAESRTALRKGAVLGTVLVIVVVGLYGLTGLLSAWAYGAVDEYTDSKGNYTSYGNLHLFYVLGEKQYTWIGALIVVLAATMNESAVDSLQNALTATITANLFRSRSVNFTRAVVLVLNIPLAALGFLGLPAASLFLITNELTTCAFIPLLSGIFDPHRRFVSGYAMVFASFFAIIATTVHGILMVPGYGFVDGIVWAWWGNNYNAFIFVTGLVASVVGLALWVGVAELLFRFAGVQGQPVTSEMEAVLQDMQTAGGDIHKPVDSAATIANPTPSKLEASA
ncbi:hypothetical protein RI367_006780 [Sorochytrium milnesiophthora]